MRATLSFTSLALLLRVGHAYADCSATTTTTISNTADASALASCATYAGNVRIAPQVTGTLNVSGLQVVNGGIDLSDSQIGSFASNTLRTVNNSLVFNNSQSLENITLPQLAVVGSLFLVDLPVLVNTDFAAAQSGVVQLTNLTIIGTTFDNLGGLTIRTADYLRMSDNPNLIELDFPVVNLGIAFLVYNNNPKLNVNLPNLQSSKNITVMNASALSIPSLSSVNGPLILEGNGFTNVSAPVLNNVDTLVVSNNPALTNLSFSKLSQAPGAGINIINNTALQGLSFPSLTTVAQDINLRGNFSSISLPILNSVDDLTIEDPGFDCDTFKHAKDHGTVKGNYTCNGGNDNGLGSGSKIAIGVGVGVGVPVGWAIAGLLAWYFIRQRRGKRRTLQADREAAGQRRDTVNADNNGQKDGVAQLHGDDAGKHELPADADAQELAGQREPVEAPDSPVKSETGGSPTEYDSIAKKQVQAVDGVYEMPGRMPSRRDVKAEKPYNELLSDRERLQTKPGNR